MSDTLSAPRNELVAAAMPTVPAELELQACASSAAMLCLEEEERDGVRQTDRQTLGSAV